MRNKSFGKLIGLSWGKMVSILFKPFSIKKWILLGIIAMLAGELMSINFAYQSSALGKCKTVKGKEVIAAGQSKLASIDRDKINELKGKAKEAMKILFKDTKFVAFLSLLFISSNVAIFLWIVLISIFAFVFIDTVVTNDVSVKLPFHKNKSLGTSYFLWNIIYASFAIAVIAGLIGMCIYGIYKSALLASGTRPAFNEVLNATRPYGLMLLASLIVFLFINFFVNDFIKVMMYSRKKGIISSWLNFIAVFFRNPADFIKFYFIKLMLAILSIFPLIFLMVIGLVVFLLTSGVLGVIGLMIIKFTPLAAKGMVSIILTAIGVPALITLLFLARFTVLPIPVFFRVFSIYFLGSLDETLDIIDKPHQPYMEDDMKKYRQSMHLLWGAFIWPIITVFLLINTVIMGANALSNARFIDLKMPYIPMKITKGDTGMPEITVNKMMVYLNNGRSFEATIEEEDSESITFDIKGGTIKLNRNDIKSVHKMQ